MTTPNDAPSILSNQDFVVTLRQSWPLWILGVACYAVYLTLTVPLEQEYQSMLNAKRRLLDENARLEESILDLEIRVQRQEDPRWQEMVLIRQLNLYEKGWRKWFWKEMP